MTPPGPAVACLDGWYAEEHDGIRPFRWMDGDAGCRVTGLAPGCQAWLQIIAACPRPDGARPILSLVVDGRAQEGGGVVGAGAGSALSTSGCASTAPSPFRATRAGSA
jgi:hypothetical protein